METEIKENKMGYMPIGKLLFTMSIPMVMSMLTQALYNIVDSIFVAMINEEALTAVSLAFPIQNFMIAIGVGTGVGVNALASRYLGAKEYDKANSVATHGVRLAFISAVLFALLILVITKPFYAIQTNDPVIYGYGVSYTRITGLICIGIMFQTMLEKLFTATGRTFYSMVIQMVGAITNIVLDPILIFGLGPFPRMEVAGAAVATVTGQCIAAVFAVFLMRSKNRELVVDFGKYPFSGKVVKNIYSIGVPSIIMASVGSLMTFGFNKILMGFSATATAVFGVYFKLQSFALMPVFGLNNGMVPIVAFNYGAAKPDRIKKTIKFAVFAAEGLLILCMLVFNLFPKQLLLMFSASENMISIGVPALRIVSLHFIFAGYSIVCGSVFQALGRGFISMFCSIMRQLLILLPTAYLLSHLIGLDAIWWSFMIAEIAVVIYNTIMLKKVYKEQIRPLYSKS